MIRRLLAGLLLLALLFSAFPHRVFASGISQKEDHLTRQEAGASGNHTITALLPTALNSPGDMLRIAFSGGFNLSALAGNDVSLTFGPITGEENTAVFSGTTMPTAAQWGLEFTSSVIILRAPLNPASGMPPASIFILKVGMHVPGGTHQIANPTTPGIYPIRILTPTEYGDFYVAITSTNTVQITATVGATTTSGGGGSGSSSGGGGAAAGDTSSPTTPTETVEVLNLRVEDIGTDHATVLWETSRSADQQVEYGETTSYGGIHTDTAPLTTSHRITIAGLAPDRTYYVRARSQTASGVSGTGTTSFRTSPTPRAPVIASIRVNTTDRIATILFTTDIDAIATVTLVPPSSRSEATRTITESASRRSHEVVFTGLTPGVTYTGTITATESTGLRSAPSTIVVSMAMDTTSPPNPSSALAFGHERAIKVQWTNPPLEAGDVIMVRADLLGPPRSVTEGRLVYSGTGTNVMDTGLLDDTLYYYTIFAIDAFGNPSSGIVTSARTLRSSTVPESEPVPPPVTPEPTPESPTPVPTRPSPGPEAVPTRPTTPGTTPTPSTGPTVGGSGSPSAIHPGTTSPDGSGTAASTTEPVIPLVPTPDTPTTPLTALTPVTLMGDPGATTATPALPLAEQTQVHVYVARGALELLSVRGIRTTLPARVLTFRLAFMNGGEAPTAGQLRVGDSTYLLVGRPGEPSWEATVVAPVTIGDTSYQVMLQYADGTRREETGTIRTRPFGVVREDALIRRDQTPVISEATVEILRADGTRWEAEPFEQQNPARTTEDGRFGFSLPQGTYRVRVTKAGFRTVERTVAVDDQVLAFPIALTKELLPLGQVLRADATLGQNAQAVLEQAGIAAQIVRDVTETPEVQEATKAIAAPTAAVATVAVTATAVSSFSAVNYARFLFTQPLLLIRRRTRKKWGVIYNALSKQPIELAVVRLLHAASGVVVQTRITDAQGRFSFLAPPGQYRVQVMKPTYTYPSAYLKEEKEDGDFLDLYHGEVITVKDGALLTPNIPVDPQVKEETPAKILWRNRLRHAQSLLGVLGTVVSIGAFMIAPSLVTGGLFALQIGSYALFRRLALPPKPKGWGITYDADSKRPLERAVVRVFDKKFNKLLETQVTDQKGKYAFFAGKGLYYITAEKLGYEKFVSSDIDLRQAKETVIDQQVALRRQEKPA